MSVNICISLDRDRFSTEGEVGASVENQENTGKEEESKEPNGCGIRDNSLWDDDVEYSLDTSLMTSYENVMNIVIKLLFWLISWPTKWQKVRSIYFHMMTAPAHCPIAKHMYQNPLFSNFQCADWQCSSVLHCQS